MFEFSVNKIIGHRGCNKTKFSNTIEAFLKAVELGADMIEFDIRKTKDNVLIVHHDADVFGHLIRENVWKDVEKFGLEKGLKIPKLEEVLQKLKGKVQFDIELKETGYEKDVVEMALKHLKSSDFIVKSFYDEAVLAVKKVFPDVSAGLLLGTNDDLPIDAHIKIKTLRILKRRLSELFPWKRLKHCHADFISPNERLLIFGLLHNAHKRNFPVLVWTMNSYKKILPLWKTGLVAGFITDEPEFTKDLKK